MSSRIAQAEALMMYFAEQTGVLGPSSPRRYLWTDAHAVCNLVDIWRQLDDFQCLELAKHLVDQVHQELGRYSVDDHRQGWISGLSPAKAAQHPTAGGLRIGKPLPERGLAEPYDEHAEWDRDGQYYHYLTKWAHALSVMSAATEDDRYRHWAVELLAVASERFRNADGTGLYWKMRVDLSAPLVHSASPHDPLDGLVTSAVAAVGDDQQGRHTLSHTQAALLQLCAPQRWMTNDPLGLGGLLFDACRLAQLPSSHPLVNNGQLIEEVLQAVVAGLAHFAATQPQLAPPSQRLAFRELGLSIGLQGFEILNSHCSNFPAVMRLLEALRPYLSLGQALEAYWVQETSRHSVQWLAHEDINVVMLATSLAPMSFLSLNTLSQS